MKNNTPQKLPYSGQFIFDNKKGVERIYLVASKTKFNELEDIIARIDSSESSTRSLDGGISDQKKLNKVITGLQTHSIVDYGRNDIEYAGYGVANTRAIKLKNKEPEVPLIIANLEHN